MDKLEYIPGDLVIYASLIKEPVAEICEVHEASYTIKFMHGNFAKVTSKEIKPITLTSEILEKNGWMLFRIYHWFIEKECLKLSLLELDNHSWYVYIGDNLIRRNMHSVSDLQHLFFGLGLNSEMEV